MSKRKKSRNFIGSLLSVSLLITPLSALAGNREMFPPYYRYLIDVGCLDANGHRINNNFCNNIVETEAEYIRYYEHLRKVGCLDANGNRINTFFCKNTEPR